MYSSGIDSDLFDCICLREGHAVSHFDASYVALLYQELATNSRNVVLEPVEAFCLVTLVFKRQTAH